MSMFIGFQVIPSAAPCANGAIIISDESLLLSLGPEVTVRRQPVETRDYPHAGLPQARCTKT